MDLVGVKATSPGIWQEAMRIKDAKQRSSLRAALGSVGAQLAGLAPAGVG